MKKILIIGINYFPEITSTGLYTTELAEYLIEKNFSVDVLTGFPYYPQWKIYDSYKDKPKYFKEKINGVEIYRYKQYIPEKITAISRLNHLYDFYKGTLKIAKKINKKYDLIINIAPTLLSAKTAIKIKTKTPKSKLWLHIQDFEVDAMIESGIFENNRIIKLLGYRWERLIYEKFDIISTISNGMMKKLVNKKIPEDKIYFLPNWVDTRNLKKVDNPELRKILNIDKNLVVMYSGSIANKQDWDIVLKSIKKLKKDKDIKFVIIGNGSKRKKIENFIKENKLKNIILLDVQPKEKLNDVLSSADIHIIPQKKNVIDSVMPSKLLGIASVGKPVLVLANSKSEIYNVVKKNKLGIVLNENEYEQLSNIILSIKNKKYKLKRYGDNARRYIEINYEKKNILDRFIEKIYKL
ncbi:hypothetical protein X275_11095 [Marinitoga sp. 1197]|uniref:WcaI family glycosyltransferase n=1 Tax=Marinitoga sp. 1197 TaxID=1428449 RepID=UPI000640DD8F|nr:WcaI family glycosyltransferase [Marinitoga sp. 1197]KLO20840.1 hypothetical protein X275_11095 [Marinitoga sp. 1197]